MIENDNTAGVRLERTVMPQSCVGCKFLYTEGTGYSNYTWESDDVRCAKDRNPNLPDEKPYDWNLKADDDNWPKTSTSRCELYADGPMVTMDVDREDGPADYTEDEEAIEAICKHSGRGRNGTAA